ncbi:unnamed protein product [Eruca vesicaria subsp. sativa]|uniref:Uncharacterized protein n=1 Tax=Eruca vesicaria subsp. sativa TaxID=29727 RepID=A0ABC8L9W6_ERUVS|nr:unnamed protein product [Eruca vesicaria subsp. sativa]
MKSKVKDEFTTPMTSFPREDFKRPFLVDNDTPELCCKDSDYALVFVPDEEWEKLNEWSLNPTRLKIGPSIFDGTLCKRIIGPGQWFKNFRKTENHLFKWIDEALIDEIRMVDAKHEMVAEGIAKFQEIVMEKVKSEMVRVEHEMSEKLNDKVNLEISRVAQEMK